MRRAAARTKDPVFRGMALRLASEFDGLARFAGNVDETTLPDEAQNDRDDET